MRTKPMQISVMAVAALAVVAVAAAMLLFGGGALAQATTETYTPPTSGGIDLRPVQDDDNPTPTPTPTPKPNPKPKPAPQQTEPEACSDNPAHVVSAGHYALLEVYWKTADKNLVNNPCPPEVVHGPNETVTRSASDINIGQTIMHVSGDSNLTLRPDNEDDYEKWPFLYPDAEDTDGNGKKEGSEIGDPYSTNVWALHDCRHDANPPPTEDDLCIGVSARLLRSSDWTHIDFEMESVREPGIAPADRGQAFVFYPHDDVPAGEEQVLWGTHDATDTGINIAPGEYLHPRWAFTQPGTYRIQAHVNGVLNKRSTLTRADSVTSKVVTYTVHVGDLSDLGVDITASEAAPNVGDQVTFTVTASNAGPDTAADTQVTVTLPAGLTYSSHSTATGTYTPSPGDPAPGIWAVGDLEVTNDENTDTSDDSPTLTIAATVADGTRGHAQTVHAAILAHETIGTSTVEELDPREGDNAAEVTITPVAVVHTAPMLKVLLSVPENSPAGTDVGDPIGVMDPDEEETLTFTLTGEGADNFTVTEVEDGVQIQVATGAVLDYETTSSYDLTLTVSDGVDHEGNDNSSVDDSIKLRINVTDVDEPITATLTASKTNPAVGEVVHLTVEVHNGSGLTIRQYLFSGTIDDGSKRLINWQVASSEPSADIRQDTASTAQLSVLVKGTNGAGQEVDITSNTVEVTWR